MTNCDVTALKQLWELLKAEGDAYISQLLPCPESPTETSRGEKVDQFLQRVQDGDADAVQIMEVVTGLGYTLGMSTSVGKIAAVEALEYLHHLGVLDKTLRLSVDLFGSEGKKGRYLRAVGIMIVKTGDERIGCYKSVLRGLSLEEWVQAAESGRRDGSLRTADLSGVLISRYLLATSDE